MRRSRLWAAVPIVALAFTAAASPAADAERPPVAAQLQSAPPNTELHEEMVASVNIPDEIAPAIIPYVNCQIASAGVPVYADGRRVAPPPGIVKGSDCGAMRRKAARNADRMLREQGMASRKARRALIDRTLAAMDAFQRASHFPPPPQNEADAPH
jgi:hypothetical protein